MKYAEYVTRGSFSKEELVAMSWGKLVEDQPYEDFAVLPAPPLLMFDRVTELRREGSRGVIIAEQDVRFDDWFFQCHFRLDPVQPGCLGSCSVCTAPHAARAASAALWAARRSSFPARFARTTVSYATKSRYADTLSSRAAGRPS